MRHTLLRCLSMTFYVVVLWPYTFSKSEDICEDNELQHRQNVIVQNDSYQYSLHYNYSMKITRHQLHPIVSDNFIKFSDNQKVYPNFFFKYYDSDVYSFYIDKTGAIAFHEGLVFINIPDIYPSDLEILNNEEMVAVKWSFKSNEDDTVGYNTQGVKSPKINVPAKWIKSETLVEYEVIGTMCSQYTTTKSCQEEKTSDMTCIWCDKANKCIASNDQSTSKSKVNDCHVETSQETEDLSTPASIKRTETTSDV